MKLPFAYLRSAQTQQRRPALWWPPGERVLFEPNAYWYGREFNLDVESLIKRTCCAVTIHGHDRGPLAMGDCITRVLPTPAWLSYRPRLKPLGSDL